VDVSVVTDIWWKGEEMGRVLVAPGWECDEGAIAEALRLLDANHEYLFLIVQGGGAATVPLGATGPAVLPPVVMPDPDVIEQAERLTEHEGQQYLQGIVDGLHINAAIRVESGDAAERICTTAFEESADLIVIGSSNTGFVQRFLGGSTSDQVAHQAPCPVLLIRRPQAGGADRDDR
jgi:nucleotide-binding universal stress UspA family protein